MVEVGNKLFFIYFISFLSIINKSGGVGSTSCFLKDLATIILPKK